MIRVKCLPGLGYYFCRVTLYCLEVLGSMRLRLSSWILDLSFVNHMVPAKHRSNEVNKTLTRPVK